MNLVIIQDNKLMHRNWLHFYILTMKYQKEKLWKPSHLLLHQKIYIWINLPKETKDLYSKNYKTLMKKIKDDTNRWKNKPWSWNGIINTVKMTIPPTQVHLQIQWTPYQITYSILHRTITKYFNICMETQRPWIAKAILRKKNGPGRIRLPDCSYTPKLQSS